MSERWYTGVLDEPSSSSSSSTSSSSSQQRQQEQEQIEEECLVVASTIISNRLLQLRNDKGDKEMNDETSTVSQTTTTTTSTTTTTTTTRAHDLAKGRFQDLTMTKEGSQILESLFLDESLVHVTDNVILYGTIYLVQSLCIMGMLVGVKGSPEQEQRRVQHLREIDNDHGAAVATNDADNGTDDGTNNKNRKSLQDMSIGNLKYLSDQTAGTQLLAKLSQTNYSGAMDLLISLGAWTKHEDLSLLRSGFPISFTDQQLQVAESAAQDTVDVDELLGIRRDMTHHKVYTIDSESTSEVDDGLSVEELEDGRHKFWIHIADADRWAPRESSVFHMAKSRTTTHYLPTGPVPMFPPSLSMGVMSLRPNMNSCALSLGVELNDDGSVNVDSLDVTQSSIKINYRLSYDDVDDMLMEGVGYKEEWQLGALMSAATKRRAYRIRNGSTEGMIPQPIPKSFVSTYDNENEPDGIGIKLSIDPSHNQGLNRTTGKWKLRLDHEPPSFYGRVENTLTLPYRSQPKPDYWAREKETKILHDLLEHKHGYCHAWYARRFLSPVAIGPDPKPHFGLGIDCYVQWTSPIRRFGDLQVHAAVKRYLRRCRIHDLLVTRQDVPAGVNPVDLGCRAVPGQSDIGDADLALDADIDYSWGKAYVSASKALNRESQQYWLYEYLHRQVGNGHRPPLRALFWLHRSREVIVCCVSAGNRLRASLCVTKGYLDAGEVLLLKVESVMPRMNLMTLSLINIG
ncbi:RNB domain [Fragilaria crotonensis]|nr:RNB domain [Fragilaria crotonensis]